MSDMRRHAPPSHEIAPRASTRPGTCPACAYDIAQLVDETGARCPECGRSFTREELERVWKGDVRGAEPRTLPAREPRIAGRRMVAIILILMLVFIALSLGSCWWAQRTRQRRAIMISEASPLLTEPMR